MQFSNSEVKLGNSEFRTDNAMTSLKLQETGIIQ